LYHDGNERLPPGRLCPYPWQAGNDLYCENILAANTYTGPNEVWWAPYDNRPGTGPTAALPDYQPDGLLCPFVERNCKVFQCPEGVDRTPGSPTFGQTYQVSYALNFVGGGPSGVRLTEIPNGTTQVLLAWEHSNVPLCYYQPPGTAARVPWPFDDADVAR